MKKPNIVWLTQDHVVWKHFRDTKGLWCKNFIHGTLDINEHIGWSNLQVKTTMNIFKWKHYEKDIILLTVRWYLKYSLSYRDIAEMMSERGLLISHTTIMRWVHEFGPEIDKRIRPFLNSTNDSFRVDETYIKVKGKWKYLYRGVDSIGNTIDFMLAANRDAPAAKRFFKKALSSSHNQSPRVIAVDKNPAYPPAIVQLMD